MLIFSTDKILKILPACPKEFKKGKAKLYFINGTVEMEWDLNNEICHGTICAHSNTEFSLHLPFKDDIINLKLLKGESYKF